MVKKVVKKKAPKKKNVPVKMSFADLYMMYTFVSNDANNKGFGMTAPEARRVVRGKQKELEEEMYKRIYGFNPFEKFSITVEGEKPENINLDRFTVVKNKPNNDDPKDDEPQTFVVAKNSEGT